MSSVDWFEWHKVYDDSNSRFAARLGVIQCSLAAVLDQMPPGPITVLSMCAGQGHDILGVLRDHPRRDEVVVTPIEQDRRNAACAREMARAADLAHVTVVVGDAGDATSYGFVPFTVECAGDPRWTVGTERFEGTPEKLDAGVRLFTVRASTAPPPTWLRRRLAKVRSRIRR